MAITQVVQNETLNELIKFFSNPLVAGVIGIIGGGIVTLSWKFIDIWIDGIKEDRKRRKTEKLQAVKDINSFVIEGMHTGFRHKAGSEHHIKFRAQEIEAIDVEVGTKLRIFLNCWSQHRNFVKDKGNALEDQKLAIEYRNKAQELGKELLEVARKWAQ